MQGKTSSFVDNTLTKYKENVVYEIDSAVLEDTELADVIHNLSEICDYPGGVLQGDKIYQISFEIDDQTRIDYLTFDIIETGFNNGYQGFAFLKRRENDIFTCMLCCRISS